MERLQKYLARCGVASRRASEELITSGRVKVNSLIVTKLGSKINIKDVVYVDDVPLTIEEKVTLVMNKPRYVLSTVNDDLGRKTIIDLLPTPWQKLRLYPIGRLDYDTKGVLLLTNDGELSNKLIGPSSSIEKEYLVRVDGIISNETLKKLASGIDIEGKKTRKARTFLESIDSKNQSSLVKIIIVEGRNHQVKKMFAAVGHKVKRLTRMRFGNIEINDLKEGQVRKLTIHELKTLHSLTLRQNNE